jgi:hypothetical protein
MTALSSDSTYCVGSAAPQGQDVRTSWPGMILNAD